MRREPQQIILKASARWDVVGLLRNVCAAAAAASSSAATRTVFGTVMQKEFGGLKKN